MPKIQSQPLLTTLLRKAHQLYLALLAENKLIIGISNRYALRYDWAECLDNQFWEEEAVNFLSLCFFTGMKYESEF